MFSSKIAVVGDFDTVSIFRSVGVMVYPVDEGEGEHEVIEQVFEEDYKIIFLTERLAEKYSSLLDKIDSETFPMVVLIPDQRGSTGLAFRRIRETVKKAIGADILKET